MFLFGGSTSIAIASSCSDSPEETYTEPCAAGYSGIITRTRRMTSDRVCSWSDWEETSNTCTIDTYLFTVNMTGTGTGTVGGSGTFNYGTTQTATATADADSTFSGWTGDCDASGSVLINSPKTCTATFTKNSTPEETSFTLTVETPGTGTGVVTGAGTYISGTIVTATANPSEGSTFDGWSGNCPNGVVTVTGNTTCTATFTLKQTPSHGSTSGSIPKVVGKVLGAETTCGIYVDKFMKKGLKGNDEEAVKKVQIFLNDYMGSNLKVDGKFGIKTDTALRAFQAKQSGKVLDPWGLSAPTGIFYLTTQTEVNNIMCPALNLPIPTLIPTDQNPDFPKF